MSSSRRLAVYKSAGAVVLAGLMAVPAVGFASEASIDPISPEAARTAMLRPAALPAVATVSSDDLLILDTSRLLADDDAVASRAEVRTAAAEQADDADELDSELECLAKVVHHEAANQSRKGQLAVAQLIMNRVESGRFPNTICGVAHQRNQFFDTTRYHPEGDVARWRNAIDVAREARDGSSKDIMPSAMFYHAAYQAPTKWFRTRTRVATLGDHIFYR